MNLDRQSNSELDTMLQEAYCNGAKDARLVDASHALDNGGSFTAEEIAARAGLSADEFKQMIASQKLAMASFLQGVEAVGAGAQ